MHQASSHRLLRNEFRPHGHVMPSQISILTPTPLAAPHPQGYDADLEAAAAAGQLGAPLLPADRPLLLLRPLRRYVAGELVAWQRPVGAAEAAAAAAERRAGAAALYGTQGEAGLAVGEDGSAVVGSGVGGSPSGAGTSRGGHMGSHVSSHVGSHVGSHVLCYACVAANSAPSEGELAYNVLLEVAPGQFEQVLSSSVFCFASAAAMTAPGAAAAAAGAAADAVGGVDAASSQGDEAGQQEQQSGGTVDAPAPVSALSSAAVVARSGDVAGSSSSSGSSSTQQPVAAAELVGAVRDMLAAAQLPLDLDRSELLLRTLEQQRDLRETGAKLAQLQAVAAAKEAEAEALKGSWQCRVCFGRDVDCAFVGCGHMYCSVCARSLASCAVCRKASAKVRLFK